MTIKQYQQLNIKEGMLVLSSKGVLVEEVISYGILRLRLYVVANFFVQAVYNKNDNKLLEIKALQSDDDWQPFLETIDLKKFY